MEKTLIFGHQNPDTDSICSAIAYAYLKQALKENVEAIRLGELNEETTFALQTFQMPIPRFVERVSREAKRAILVDHNEFQQSARDIRDVQILEVIDHHRVSNFETSDPLYMRIEAVGCTSTILYKLFQEKQIIIPKEIAGLMLSAILSDTLLFQSPTCTKEDEFIAKKLATIAEVDVQIYGLELLKAGANVRDKSVEELLTVDAKTFQIGNYAIKIAQINTVDFNDVLDRKEEIEKCIYSISAKEKLDLFLFVVTDILNSNSLLLALGDDVSYVEKSFNVTLQENIALLSGIVSRKKQIVPALTKTLNL
jgi:manganese-dependent inorganic pyrophosphatase